MIEQPILEIKNLTVEFKTPYGSLIALRNLNLAIHDGKTLGLVGESGSGKSTVAWVIMRYLADNGRVIGGEVRFRGEDLLSLTHDDLRGYRGKKIAMVYQDPMTSLNPSMAVGSQIQEVIDLHQGGNRKENREKVVELLTKVNIEDPQSSARKFPHELSGGQQQRVVIAMALACNPDLLILDEPTTGLDVTTEAAILDLIQELKNKFRSAILFISHNLGVIARIADYVGVIYAGYLVEEGPVREIFSRPFHPYTKGLIRCIPKIQGNSYRKKLIPIRGTFPNLFEHPRGCIFYPRCDYAIDFCENTSPKLNNANSERKSACHRWQELKEGRLAEAPTIAELNNNEQTIGSMKSIPEGKGLFELDSVKKYFGGVGLFKRLMKRDAEYVHAVDGVTLQIARGEVFGLVGESGCGKTTLGRSIAKLHRVNAGYINYQGYDIWKLSRQQNRMYHKDVQMIFQNPDSSLNPKKNIGEILARPLQLYRRLTGIDLEKAIDEFLEMVRLGSTYRLRFPFELSGGEKQRVGIARAFAAEPRFVICDEPVSSLDVSVLASVLNLIIDLKNEFGVALLFISHDLSVVQYISHDVGIMYLGKLVEIGDVTQVFSPPYHPYTQALLSAVPSIDLHEGRETIHLVGSVPSARRPPNGCRFHTRCPQKIGRVCEDVVPGACEIAPGHSIYCHLYA